MQLYQKKQTEVKESMQIPHEKMCKRIAIRKYIRYNETTGTIRAEEGKCYVYESR